MPPLKGLSAQHAKAPSAAQDTQFNDDTDHSTHCQAENGSHMQVLKASQNKALQVRALTEKAERAGQQDPCPTCMPGASDTGRLAGRCTASTFMRQRAMHLVMFDLYSNIIRHITAEYHAQ